MTTIPATPPAALATRFEVAGAVMISLIAAILVREALRAIRAHRE